MWEQKNKDWEFIGRGLEPIIKMIEEYKIINNHYPTEEELNYIVLGTSYENIITKYKSDRTSYRFSIWRGEWEESYSSIEKIYSTGQVYFADHLIFTSIGLISFVFLVKNLIRPTR